MPPEHGLDDADLLAVPERVSAPDEPGIRRARDDHVRVTGGTGRIGAGHPVAGDPQGCPLLPPAGAVTLTGSALGNQRHLGTGPGGNGMRTSSTPLS